MKPIFEKSVLISFGDADPQGFVFFARVAEMAHQALEDFWSRHERGWKHWFQNPKFAVPLRHSATDFLSPMRVGQSYGVKLSVKNITGSSIEFVTEFVGPSEETSPMNTLCAQVTTVHVFVDRTNFRKMPVPEEIRAALA